MKLNYLFLRYGSGPREDATRIGSAGVVRRQAVDISPLRRVNQAIYLLTTGARESAFRNVKTIAECLADELINAAKGSSNRYRQLLVLSSGGVMGGFANESYLLWVKTVLRDDYKI